MIGLAVSKLTRNLPWKEDRIFINLLRGMGPVKLREIDRSTFWWKCQICGYMPKYREDTSHFNSSHLYSNNLIKRGDMLLVRKYEFLCARYQSIFNNPQVFFFCFFFFFSFFRYFFCHLIGVFEKWTLLVNDIFFQLAIISFLRKLAIIS